MRQRKRAESVVTIAGQPSEEKAQARGIRVRDVSPRPERCAQLDALTALVDAGIVKATISAVYPLDQAQAAIDKSREGHTRGKIVLEIPDFGGYKIDPTPPRPADQKQVSSPNSERGERKSRPHPRPLSIGEGEKKGRTGASLQMPRVGHRA